jgi:hypothetical protein
LARVGDPVGEGDRFTVPSSDESIAAGLVLYPLVDRLVVPAENSGAGPAGLAFSGVPGSCIASGGREPAAADREQHPALRNPPYRAKITKTSDLVIFEKYSGF